MLLISCSRGLSPCYPTLALRAAIRCCMFAQVPLLPCRRAVMARAAVPGGTAVALCNDISHTRVFFSSIRQTRTTGMLTVVLPLFRNNFVLALVAARDHPGVRRTFSLLFVHFVRSFDASTGWSALETLNIFCTTGIYTIPEISMVGKTEAQLTRAGVSYEVGVADYREVRMTELRMLGTAVARIGSSIAAPSGVTSCIWRRERALA